MIEATIDSCHVQILATTNQSSTIVRPLINFPYHFGIHPIHQSLFSSC